jgi:hypothetical protein
MRHRKLLAGIAVGSLAALGGFGFGRRTPGEDAGPPDGMPEEAENGCNGIEEAQDRIGEDNPASTSSTRSRSCSSGRGLREPR